MRRMGGKIRHLVAGRRRSASLLEDGALIETLSEDKTPDAEVAVAIWKALSVRLLPNGKADMEQLSAALTTCRKWYGQDTGARVERIRHILRENRAAWLAQTLAALTNTVGRQRDIENLLSLLSESHLLFDGTDDLKEVVCDNLPVWCKNGLPVLCCDGIAAWLPIKTGERLLLYVLICRMYAHYRLSYGNMKILSLEWMCGRSVQEHMDALERLYASGAEGASSFIARYPSYLAGTLCGSMFYRQGRTAAGMAALWNTVYAVVWSGWQDVWDGAPVEWERVRHELFLIRQVLYYEDTGRGRWIAETLEQFLTNEDPVAMTVESIRCKMWTGFQVAADAARFGPL